MMPRSPQSEAEWAAYRDLRWRVLRAPWGQPASADDDELEFPCTHLAVFDDDGRALAVGRIVFKSADQAQIRSMAVDETRRDEGLGRRIIAHLEQAAREAGVRSIVLHARENAVDFYARQGYEVVGEGPLLFGVIHHATMQKQL
jgi:predicted GNAT family N-acyltransferase